MYLHHLSHFLNSLILVSLIFTTACSSSDDDDTPTNPSDTLTEELISGGQLTRSFAGTGALSSPFNSQIFCTATLVSQSLVLTAAHCVDNISSGEVVFLIGVDAQQSQSYSVTNINLHPLWDGHVQNGHDAAILTLSTTVNNVEHVEINLSNPSTLHGKQAALVGYGRSFDEAIGQGIRRKATVSILGSSAHTLDFTFNGSGACQGDSGGPAYIQESNDIWKQVGITSWGDPQCLGDYHYQRLDVISSWLLSSGVPSSRSTTRMCSTQGVCDGSCEEDQDCWEIVCPSGSCTAQNSMCVADNFCDALCGNSDPDCGSNTQDYCAIYGLYGNGYCDTSCPQFDNDCSISSNICTPTIWQIDIFGFCNYADFSGRVCFTGPSFINPFTGFPYCP